MSDALFLSLGFSVPSVSSRKFISAFSKHARVFVFLNIREKRRDFG